MRHYLTTFTIFLFTVWGLNPIFSQCGVNSQISTANNMYGIIDNRNNPVVVDKDLNTVVFVHRQNTATFGGNSGNLRFDFSTNGGASWTSNIGPLNPTSTSHARYPNAVLYNPSGNTNPSNAYIGYLGITINPSSGGFNGVVSGAGLLGGGGISENYNLPSAPSYFKPMATVKGAPGVFWAIDHSANMSNSALTGTIMVYKGVWNSGSNSINWTVNTNLVPPFNPNSTFIPLGECKIAFDPTGTFGWIGFVGDITNSNSVFALNPVFYKTINGGASWTGPFMFDLNNVSCITSNISFGADAGAFRECDLTVDINGQPHFLCVVGENSGYAIDANVWHSAMDITYNGSTWSAIDIAEIYGDDNNIIGPISTVVQAFAPQIARTADGKKIFYTWSDNTLYFQGAANASPDFMARGFDVQTSKWTNVKDFSSCNTSSSGRIFFPHVAKEVIEPSLGAFKLAPFYGEFSSTNDPDSPVNYKFLDNCLFGSAEFTVSQNNMLALSVSPGTTAILCPGTPLLLEINGAFSTIHWSNGPQSTQNTVLSPGNYSVIAQSGCLTGTASILVNPLTFSASSASTTICPGTTVNLGATGNAYGYTWTPGNITGTSVAVNPSVTTTYTVWASGDDCLVSSTLGINLNPAPNVAIVSNHSVSCAGDPVILQVAGPNVLVWSNGSISSSIAISPTNNVTYSVTGTNSLGCSATASFEQVVFPCVGINTHLLNNELLSLYPNPSSGNFTIKTNTECSLTVSNAIGQVISIIDVGANTNFQFLVDNLSPGIYFVSGFIGNSFATQKVVVER